MWSHARRREARDRFAALSGPLVLILASALSACSIDERQRGVAPGGIDSNGGQAGTTGQAGASGLGGIDNQPDASPPCTGPDCAGIEPDLPLLPECADGCPTDDACRSYALGSVDAGTTAVDNCGCAYTWKPASRDGAACVCDAAGCVLLAGEACATGSACQGGNCVATASGTSVCCAVACGEAEVCAPDGASCLPAEPCTGEGRRCSGALHQNCVEGSWQTIDDCGAVGCSTALDSCFRAAGEACESDADCGQGTCLPAEDGNRVCCTGACGNACQRCSTAGTECVNVADDEACGEIECPSDPCRTYDPATVVTNRCNAGQCATVAQACTNFEPQRANLECSDTLLCDSDGNCSLPKRALLAACSSGEQCASGACVATAQGTSVCCTEACEANEVCGPTGNCGLAPVCANGDVQCSGSNYQECSGGQWVTQEACGQRGCSLARGGCFAGAGDSCTTTADCGQGTCLAGVGGGSICCTASCGGNCRLCGASGTSCVNQTSDTRCSTIRCGDFDADCVSVDNDLVASCTAGQCSQLRDCGFLSAGSRCSGGGQCDGAGNCNPPRVECVGAGPCDAADGCCNLQDFQSARSAQACGESQQCDFSDADFVGPTMLITCDEHADCINNDRCCVMSTNVNSGDVRCRDECTAEAVARETGFPPEMIVVAELCANENGDLPGNCPASAPSCEVAVNSLPAGYRWCRAD